MPPGKDMEPEIPYPRIPYLLERTWDQGYPTIDPDSDFRSDPIIMETIKICRSGHTDLRPIPIQIFVHSLKEYIFYMNKYICVIGGRRINRYEDVCIFKNVIKIDLTFEPSPGNFNLQTSYIVKVFEI